MDAYDSLEGLSAEPTLADLLRNLTESVAEYQGVVNRMFEIHSARIDLGDRISGELRDDLHDVANRVEALTRKPLGVPDAPDTGY